MIIYCNQTIIVLEVNWDLGVAYAEIDDMIGDYDLLDYSQLTVD